MFSYVKKWVSESEKLINDIEAKSILVLRINALAKFADNFGPAKTCEWDKCMKQKVEKMKSVDINLFKALAALTKK